MTDSEPYPVPNPDWTPKQRENWDNVGYDIYRRLETDVGREWYRRCWRPKKRNEGMMETDAVKLGNPEDYVAYEVEDTFDPWGSIMGSMMRQLGGYSVSKEVLDEAVSDILQAKLQKLRENDPDAAKRLLRESTKVAQLYGAEA